MKLDNVIEQLIGDTPVGEITRVIDDLKKISTVNINNVLRDVMKKYNVDNNVIAQSSKGGIVLSSYNEQEEAFVDHVKGLRITVDHLTLDVVEETPFEQDDLCLAISQQLDQYIEEKYPNQVTTLVTPEVILIIGEKNNSANFWNARWRAAYDFDGSKLTGEINIDIHYYEDGNVRLTTAHNVDEPCEEPVKSIQLIEDLVEREVTKSIIELNDSQFKSLRRTLPVTRAKVQWNNAIGNYRLGKDVTN
jgi:capping protein alpha